MWQLIRKDLVRRWRSPLSTLVMIAFPLLMSLALGTVYSGGGGGDEDFPRIRLLVQNRDEDGFLSQAIIGSLGQEQAQEFLEVVVVGDEGAAMMEKGEASALIVLPPDFTRDVLDGRPAAIGVVRNPAEGIKPEIIVQGAGLVATYVDQGARLLGDELGSINEMIHADSLPPTARVAALAGSIMERFRGADRYLFPPLVRIGSVKESAAEEDSGGSGIFGYILIMTTVMALMLVASRSLGDVYDEQKSGMLRRQLSTPVGVEMIVGAKMIFGAVLGLLVMAILAAIGLLMGWIAPPIDPLGALLVAASFSLAASGCLALVIALCRTEKQAGIWSWLVVMGMSALGGSLTPVQGLPAPMRAIAPFTINYWAIDGFTRLIFDGQGAAGVLRNAFALTATGIVTTLAAQFLLVRRFRESSS